ncbi:MULTISPECIES: MerR family transcriptional regulator [unclassified Ruminococcus]|uniref:MerR family transcriptional regulator n=1 Tax=unclassified Ruminococcus TaxID=2608920 RepID=UPI00210B23FE|nr:MULTISPECIES: MerR family transcriptional regulator [unclassified Ruminococcus]MCQ4022900.1 MerR family transcriptional regulator [Ruminococcus sp. zg-924]MCQ4115284.1 MerR family transcriptional regulator [Ruminococcus sp. zg-921]
MLYTIGDMAKLLSIAPSTLRYYDKEGLLPFMERSESGIRVFHDSDLEFLKIIHCLKATGMQIKDIREFILLVMKGDETIDARLELFQKRKAEVEKQIAQLEQTLDTINFKCWYYETAKAAGTTAVPDNMADDELPSHLRETRARLRR